MRVIAGTKRGFRLQGFEGESVRPTTDRVKENIFNIITGCTADAVVADLFAGTGALTIEALSRSAQRAVVCDTSDMSLGIIRANLAKTGFEEQTQVIKTDALNFLQGNTQRFDIIFLDPPYNKGLGRKALQLIGEKSALTPDGIAVLERDAGENIGEVDGLRLIKSKKYGHTCIDLYKMDK